MNDLDWITSRRFFIKIRISCLIEILARIFILTQNKIFALQTQIISLIKTWRNGKKGLILIVTTNWNDFKCRMCWVTIRNGTLNEKNAKQCLKYVEGFRNTLGIDTIASGFYFHNFSLFSILFVLFPPNISLRC